MRPFIQECKYGILVPLDYVSTGVDCGFSDLPFSLKDGKEQEKKKTHPPALGAEVRTSKSSLQGGGSAEETTLEVGTRKHNLGLLA